MSAAKDEFLQLHDDVLLLVQAAITDEFLIGHWACFLSLTRTLAALVRHKEIVKSPDSPDPLPEQIEQLRHVLNEVKNRKNANCN